MLVVYLLVLGTRGRVRVFELFLHHIKDIDLLFRVLQLLSQRILIIISIYLQCPNELRFLLLGYPQANRLFQFRIGMLGVLGMLTTLTRVLIVSFFTLRPLALNLFHTTRTALFNPLQIPF